MADSDGSAVFNTVFIDTSLDTHLATMVSDSETVADLKKKIMFEHTQCFPNIAEINIHALKVKRKGYFYHLSDSMIVKSAFVGVKKNWFLCLDASSPTNPSEWHSGNPNSRGAIPSFGVVNSDDRNNLLSEGPSRRLSILNDSSLLQLESRRHLSQKVPHNSPFGPGNSDLALKDLGMIVEHDNDNHLKPSSSDTKGCKAELQEKCYPCNEDVNVLQRLAEGEEAYSKDGIGDLCHNNSLDEQLRSRHVSKKKHKVKKKNEDDVHDHGLEENDSSICASSKDTSQPDMMPENSLGNAGKGISIKMGNKHVDGGPDASSMLHSEVQKNCVLSEENVRHNGNSKNGIGDVQCNNILGVTSASRPSAKRRRKSENESGAECLLEGKNALSSKTGIETPNQESVIPTSSFEDKQKNINIATDGVSTEFQEDAHLLNTSADNEKGKRRKKTKRHHDQVVNAAPSPMKVIGEENSAIEMQINHKDSCAEFGAAIITGKSVQGAVLSQPCAITPEEELCNLVQEVGDKMPHASLGGDLRGDGVGNTECQFDASEVMDLSGAKRLSSSKKHHAAGEKGLPPLVVKEPDNLKKDVMISGQNDKNPEEGELTKSPKAISSEMCEPLTQVEAEKNVKGVDFSSKSSDANNVVETGNPSGKRLKSRAKKHVTRKETKSGMGHANGFVSGISSTKPNKTSDVVSAECCPPPVVEEPENLKKDVMLSGQTDETREERELQQIPKVVLSERCEPFNQDETEENVKTVDISKLGANGVVETRNPPGKKCKSKGNKSVARTETKLGLKQGIEFVGGISSDEPYKASSAVPAEGLPPLVFEKPEHLIKDVIFPGKGNEIVEEGELQRSPEVISSERPEILSQDETEKNVKEVDISFKFSDANEVVETKNPSGKKRKSRGKKSVARKEVKSRAEHVNDFVSEPNKISSAVSAEGLPPLVAKEPENLKKDVIFSGKTDEILEEIELQQCSKVISSERCEPLGQDEVEKNVKEVEISKLSDANRVVETGNPSGKKSKSRRKKSVIGKESKSGIEQANNFMSGISSTEPNKTSSAVKVRGLPPIAVEDPDNLKKEILLSGKTDEILEEREPLHCIKAILSERCEPLNQDEAEISINKVDIPSKLSGPSGVMETINPSGKRLKSRGKKSVARKLAKSGIEHATGSVSGSFLTGPDKTSDGDHSSDEAKKEECNLSQSEMTEVPQIRTVNISLVNADGKADEASENEDEPLQVTQINKSQESTERMDEDLRRKYKRSKNFAAKDLQGSPIKEHDVRTGKKTRTLDSPSKTVRKNRQGEISSLTGSKLESERITRDEFDSSHYQDNNCRMPVEANIAGHPITNSQIDDRNNMDTSTCKNDGVNFSDYFLPRQHRHEDASSIVVVDQLNNAKKSDMDLKTKKNTKHDVFSVAAPSDLQSSLKSNKDPGNRKKPQELTGSSPLKRLLSKGEHSELLPSSNKKSSNVSAKAVKASHSHYVKVNSTAEKSRKPNVVGSSGISRSASAYSKEKPKEGTEASATSSSYSESSGDLIPPKKKGKGNRSHLDRYRVIARKASNKNPGEVMNNSEQDKSLLAMSSAIFKDSGESSEDEDEVENSDTSTRTPSDYSSSSGYSMGASKVNLDFSQNGSDGRKRKDEGEKPMMKSIPSGSKDITMNMILRSSSRYKKAKLTASQSQLEDTESQPVDFVPDSQTNLAVHFNMFHDDDANQWQLPHPS
ncbi:uncharacterized protein LOC131144664 isoform X2 [Malania oleifera]|uniref:uncharacterized protein LOC131144664 isoform X2 n=1 Tax=Malania oleifera TaxID=397392 RepID=UPI0025AE1207|nr:uncharacterized protein LOC131144664 isoform X2 [Malania oleifera]